MSIRVAKLPNWDLQPQNMFFNNHQDIEMDKNCSSFSTLNLTAVPSHRSKAIGSLSRENIDSLSTHWNPTASGAFEKNPSAMFMENPTYFYQGFSGRINY
jgi:hypothetical protein